MANVTKTLAVMEDLAIGKDKVYQSRGVGQKVDLHYVVDSTEQLKALDSSKYHKARIYSDNSFADFTYVTDPTSGIKASNAVGSWALSSLMHTDALSEQDKTYKGLFADGFTYELSNDVGVDADGNSWIYVGDGAPNKVVATGTVPSVSAGYQQVTFNGASGVISNDGNNLQYHIDDINGFTDALLDDAGIAPSGLPDTAVSSQRLEAIKFTAKKATRVFNEVIDGTSRDLQSRSLDTLNILDFGGLDDDDGSLTTTNSLTAFADAFAYLNSIGGGKLYLPKTQTGGYFINGDDNTPVTTPIEVVADEGVYLRIIYSGGITNSPFANNNLKYNRELLKIQQNFGFKNYGGSKVGIRPSETLPALTQTQGVYSEPRALSGFNFVAVNLADPDGTLTPVSQTSDSISFDSTGIVAAAIKATKIGEEVFALISNPKSGKFLAGVKTLNGHAFYSQDSGTQAVTLTDNTSGLSDIALGVSYTLMKQQRDLFNNSLMSVRVISLRKFSVLCNGMVIGTYNTRSNIVGVMFGADKVAGNTSISQFSAVKTNSTGGSKPLRIIALGDSISDNDVQYSPYRFMSSILQTQGQQLAELNNLSVAGETAGQQLTRLQATGAGYDYCLAQVGVNDIQGATSYASFVQTIKDICSHAIANGAIPIIGIPTPYYSLAEANAQGQAGGQNTANNFTGHTYRALLIRAVGAAGGLVNLQSIKNYGAMTASWLDATIEGVQVDSIVVDNIHPTPYGAMMIGLGWAESIIGALHRFNDSEHVLPETVPSSWMRNGFGTVSRPKMKGFELSGTVDYGGGASPEGNTFMQLPKYLRPINTVLDSGITLKAGGLPAGVASFYMGTDGNCYGFNLPGTTQSMSINAKFIDEAFV